MSASSSVALAQRLAGLALLVAGGHLAYALTAGSPATPSVAGPGPSTPAAAPECRCDDAALRSEVADLRRALRALEQTTTVRTGPATPWLSPPAEQPPPKIIPSAEELAVAVPADRPLPPIDLFVDIPDGVELSQRPDGTVQVKALRPELVGEELLLHALTKDGEMQIITARAE